jgi:hypothetical protein
MVSMQRYSTGRTPTTDCSDRVPLPASLTLSRRALLLQGLLRRQGLRQYLNVLASTQSKATDSMRMKSDDPNLAHPSNPTRAAPDSARLPDRLDRRAAHNPATSIMSAFGQPRFDPL